MKSLKLVLAGACALVMAACSPAATTAEPEAPVEAAANTLTAEEQAEGWTLLFDGTSLANWRTFKGEGVAPQWQAVDGALTLTAGGAGDIITVEEYQNFDFRYEWKISEGGNSGVMFNVVEAPQYEQTYLTGPEMQILDNERHSDGVDPTHRAGANYDLHAPATPAVRPVGEWNEARIEVNNGHVRQWLNGELVVEYDLWTPEWEAMVRESKFFEMPDYGRARQGHIALQDHGDQVWFRNVKIRRL